MIEKLFRGRIKKTKKWVYGYYCKSPITDGNSGLPPSAGWYFLSGEERHLIIQDSVAYTVDSETVGQYTGLDDKNSVKIFEGDIVNCSRGCPHEVYFTTEHGGFLGGMPAFYLKGLREGYTWMGVEEAIGNIHDKEV